MLVPQFVSASEHDQRQPRDHDEKNRDHGDAAQRMYVRHPEETVSESIDHVEERVEMRKPLPERRERMDRVEHTRKKRQRHDQKILERGDLIDLLRPDAGHHAERAQNGASEERKGENPQRVAKL